MITSEIRKQITPEGLLQGSVALMVTIEHSESKEGIERTENEVFELLTTQSKIGRVEIIGNLSEEPEIKPLIEALVNNGRRVTFITKGSEDISVLHSAPNFRVVLKTKVPNKNVNELRDTNLKLLRENDELHFLVSKGSEYSDLLVFCSGRVITKPVIYFDIREFKDQEKFLNTYFEDCEKFRFRNRIIT